MGRTALLILACAAASGCAANEGASQAAFKPLRGVVVGKDWTPLKEDAARQVFIQLDKVPEGQPQIAHLRYEERQNQGTPTEPMLSAKTAFEFNCYTGKFRSHATTFYARPNLQDPYPFFGGGGPRNWVKPQANSIASAAYEVACATEVAEK